MDLDGLLTNDVRVGVTGFSRAGKTVFICALAQALLTATAWRGKRGQGPLAEFGPFECGRFSLARIRRDESSSGLPEFPLNKIREALTGIDARWPSRTEGISRLELELAVAPKGAFQSFLQRMLNPLGEGHIRLELIDYPGEWLIDLPMLDQDFAKWSETVLAQATNGPRENLSQGYKAWLESAKREIKSSSSAADEASNFWRAYLHSATEAGFVFNQPGMAVCPDVTRDPTLFSLAPLPLGEVPASLFEEMTRRFERYKKEIIKPFYTDHFAKIDRQIVLVDLLRVLEAGKHQFEDLLTAQRALIPSFNYSKGGALDWIGGVRTTRVLFAATKADHVVRGDRENLANLLRKMLRYVDVDNELAWSTKAVETVALCSVRATEDFRLKATPHREVLLGKPAAEKEDGHWDPGGLPLDMPPDWDTFAFKSFRFEPRPMPEAYETGFPSIHLGRALDFLIGEDFQ